jgi:tetratricopeptide (TPR) repeat protein
VSRPATLLLAALALSPGFARSAGAVAADPQPSDSPIEAALDRARDLQVEGRLPEALTAYREVAAAAGADPASAASARNNACVVLMDLGDYRAALAECREAMRLRRPLDDPPLLARTLNNLGLVLQYLGRFGEAERAFREALAINRREGDAESEAINLSNLGLAATSAGRYTRALALHAQAAALAERHAGEPWATEQLQVARVNQGVVLEKLGAYREALALYRQALAGADLLPPADRAALEVNVGVVYRNLGDPVRAVEAFERAAAIYRELGDEAALANAWVNLGLARHLNLHRPRAAEAAYGEALRHATAAGDRGEEVQARLYLGQLLLDERRPREAEAAFREALSTARAGGGSEGAWAALDGLGRAAVARGDLRRALNLFGAAITEIERVRATLPDQALRSTYLGEKRDVYAAAVAVLARLDEGKPGQGHAERALEIAQRAKVRELLDALGRPRRPATPLSAETLRERVGSGVLVEYFLGDRDLYAWVVREDGIRMANLGPREPILAAAAEVHGDLAHGRKPAPEQLGGLSRTLLGPAAPYLEDDMDLALAPEGALRYLPFELLPWPGTRPDEELPGARAVKGLSGAHRDEGPLVERATVRYLPSGSALAWLGRREEDESGRPARTLLGFGAPRLPRTAPAAGLAALTGTSPALPPLPGAARELAAVAWILGGESEILTGEQATEAAFRREIPRGARVVHLATHAVIDERPGRGAAVLLTPSGDDDGLLGPDEIAALRCRADLAVLAACRTALAPEGEDGDALASLTGAFLAAGSPAVIATLWDVGDDASAAFMEQLYHHLAQGHPPAEALRRAKLRLLADPRWSRPHLWAGYILVGDGGEGAAPKRPAILWAAALLLVLATATALTWHRLRRRAGPMRGR